MAVHDVDLSSDNRGQAMPLVHDIGTGRKADGTQGLTHKIDGDTGAYVISKDGRVLVNDGDNDRIILGLLPDGTFGLVISQEGTDVEDLF